MQLFEGKKKKKKRQLLLCVLSCMSSVGMNKPEGESAKCLLELQVDIVWQKMQNSSACHENRMHLFRQISILRDV